jgi:hypothetical protein
MSAQSRRCRNYRHRNEAMSGRSHQRRHVPGCLDTALSNWAGSYNPRIEDHQENR